MLDIEDGKVLDSRFNPLKSLENEYRKRLESNFSANGAFTFKFTDDLSLRISGGYLEYTMKNEEFNGSATTTGNPYSLTGRGVNGAIYWYERHNWLNENTLTWNKTLADKHRFNLLGGITFQGDNYKYNGTVALSSTARLKS